MSNIINNIYDNNMSIKQIYDKLQNVGCLTFSSVDENGYPDSRIAHFRAFDDDGLYFMTMHTKPFYTQLKNTGKISVCGMSADSTVKHTSDGKPIFNPGYTIRLSGDVKEISMQDIKKKNNPIFDFCIYDQTKYPAMVVFVINSFKGDIFDYDFLKTKRNNKLEREFFTFGNKKNNRKFLQVNDKCVKCGKCYKVCSFDAMTKLESGYQINKNRCDECGDCINACPVNAIGK